ncbi:MAG: ribbon-helix-helix domain-containing protein [Acidimicrobiia bacterium]|nr:ribbon-helix-helix domain-containing protein [Acidimicrobiia bacterium]
MRTTVRIDGDLYNSVKERAARSGRTVAEVIEDALRHAMTARDSGPADELAPLPTFGGSGVLPGIDLASGAALRDSMQEDVGPDARR